MLWLEIQYPIVKTFPRAPRWYLGSLGAGETVLINYKDGAIVFGDITRFIFLEYYLPETCLVKVGGDSCTLPVFSFQPFLLGQDSMRLTCH